VAYYATIWKMGFYETQAFIRAMRREKWQRKYFG
jgi:hypothetical protein